MIFKIGCYNTVHILKCDTFFPVQRWGPYSGDTVVAASASQWNVFQQLLDNEWWLCCSQSVTIVHMPAVHLQHILLYTALLKVAVCLVTTGELHFRFAHVDYITLAEDRLRHVLNYGVRQWPTRTPDERGLEPGKRYQCRWGTVFRPTRRSVGWLPWLHETLVISNEI